MKYRTQTIAKNEPSAHHRTTLSGYIFATKACIDNRKNLLNTNTSSTCPHTVMNFSPLTAEIGWGSLVWGAPANFNRFRVLASLLQRRRSPEANQTLHDVWPSPELVHICISGGCCPLTEFCQVQNSRCAQVLPSVILAALLHGTPAAGVSQALRRGTRNRSTELSKTAPPIIGWAAITLGIGPHICDVTSPYVFVMDNSTYLNCAPGKVNRSGF